MFNTTRLLTTAALAAVLFAGAASAHDYVPLKADTPNATQLNLPADTATPNTTPSDAQTYYNPTPAAVPTVSAPSNDKWADKAEEHVETRIRTLHDGLKITPDEEAQFGTVAQTMRDNEAKMQPLYEARMHGDSMSAIDNLKNHEQLTAAYANSFNSFISAFEPLYNSMPDSQKQLADKFFAKEDKKMHHMHKHMKHGAKSAKKSVKMMAPAQ